MRETKSQAITYKLLDITTKYLEIDKKTRSYGTDVEIHYSEIHAISAIAKIPGIHIGGLSDYLGITKGGVSEVIQKLVKKGLVQKETSQDNLSKLSIFLTEKGKTAHENHLKYHGILDKMVANQLENVSDDKLDFLIDFLKEVQNNLIAFEEKINN